MIRYCTWRNVNAAGAVISACLWGFAGILGWVHSVAFISHISMFTMIVTFVAAWRADSPNPEEIADEIQEREKEE